MLTAMRFRLAFLIASAIAVDASAQKAPTTSATKILYSNALILDLLSAIAKQARVLPANSNLEISSDIIQEQSLIGARKIIFKDGKTLTISSRTSEPVVIFAEEIEIQGNSKITWGGLTPITNIPPSRGKASDGPPGRGDGTNGGNGANGEAGNSGYKGQPAPSLTIYAQRIRGSGKLLIDLRGQDGGIGGKGQDGGDGGPGGPGTPASSSLFDCRRGPGMGGTGGNGGNAGIGGLGGHGGNGGNVTLIVQEVNPEMTATISGGLMGKGGSPGEKGKRGIGGREGNEALPFCRSAQRNGQNGAEGGSATEGADGANGANGLFSQIIIAESQIEVLFSDAPWKVK